MRSDPVTLLDVVVEARRWLDVPWRHQGRTRAGLDCAGLVVVVGHALDLVSYDFVGYPRRASGFSFVEHFQLNMDPLRITDAAPGDVLLFADHAYPCHCGIISCWPDNPHFVHPHITRRKVVEEPYIGEWPEKVRFAFRFRGLVVAKSVPGEVPVPAGDGASRQTVISGGVV